MKRLGVLLSALLAGSLLFARPMRALASPSHEVLLLEPADTPERWVEAEHRVAAELETAGFRVVRRGIGAGDQETIMRQLLNSEPAFASLVMLREGKGGAALLWLSGTARIKRFAMADISSSLAAGAIALRVAEYLNMQVLTIQVPPPAPRPEPPLSAPPRKPPEVRTPTRDPGVRRTRGLVWLGPSAVFSSDADSVAAGLSFGVGVSVLEALSLEASAELLPVPLRIDSNSGTTRVSGFSARALAQFDGRFAGRWTVSLGLGAGVLRAESDSEAAPGFQARSDATTTTLVAARARLELQLAAGLGLLASLDPALSLPALSVRADDAEIARLGQPWFSATLGAAWSF